MPCGVVILQIFYLFDGNNNALFHKKWWTDEENTADMNCKALLFTHFFNEKILPTP